MANPEHLEILNQGMEVWNKWRDENRELTPDFSGARLSGTRLIGVDFSRADLSRANLCGAYLVCANLSLSNLSLSNLRRADFREADLCGANISQADLNNATLLRARLRDVDFRRAGLCGADLRDANLRRADLRGADLQHANLSGVDLTDADLRGANLSDIPLRGANLSGADFRNVKLLKADFTSVVLGSNSFGDTNLGQIKGLETVRHDAPSTIGIDTLYKSGGSIPEVFLRGCGLSDWQIESAKLYQTELSNEEITNILYRVHDLRAHQAIQISPLFISYSHADSPFIDKVEAHLNKKGVRFWRDVHHSTAGRLEKQIDHAIRLNPTVLLVLSDHSVRSDWVEHEARLARKLEQETGRDVLCPIALDDSWMTCRWPERLREQIEEYNILDFSNWQDADKMRRMFTRLIEGLGLFYK
jgi:uncharacterized protein YjbI with pentapeptide repeats